MTLRICRACGGQKKVPDSFGGMVGCQHCQLTGREPDTPKPPIELERCDICGGRKWACECCTSQKSPKPAPASAETLEQFADFIDGKDRPMPFLLTQEFRASLRAGADALRRRQSTQSEIDAVQAHKAELMETVFALERRLQSTEQSHLDERHHWIVEAEKQAQRAEAAIVRAEAAEQRVKELEAEVVELTRAIE